MRPEQELRTGRELRRAGYRTAKYQRRRYYFKEVETPDHHNVLYIYEQNGNSRQWFRLSHKFICRDEER